ncbi:MAG TPA: hypothetical protein ENK05_13425 [Gammaproteobacteria bacterium]|nr:hypothetical protein [Gammaproteobacteria bacterium]
MESLSIEECVQAIRAGEPLHASVNEDAFFVRIEDYVHFVATAIHNGHRMHPQLAAKCALSAEQRRYEEDPWTADLIAGLPITIVGNDSRFEYDLNRSPQACIHEQAWGQVVWRQPPDADERERSREKHRAFYQVLGALYERLESLHRRVLVWDVHAYNYRRPGMGEVPLFNIGTEQLDHERWQEAIEAWAERLARVDLPGIEVRVGIDEVFYGRGYHATFVCRNFHDTLVLPTEVKKVFMDELSGQPRPEVLKPLAGEFGRAAQEYATHFASALKAGIEDAGSGRQPE